jgi:KDPG and KHG aldolase
MLRLGAKPGTQNIDRILRLPGATNMPNAAKRERGRVACATRLLWFEDGAYPPEAFPKPDEKASGERHDDKSDDFSGGADDQLSEEDFKELLLPGVATASEAMAMLERGYSRLKFFPAESVGGAGHLRSLAAPLPALRFCPMGGHRRIGYFTRVGNDAFRRSFSNFSEAAE